MNENEANRFDMLMKKAEEEKIERNSTKIVKLDDNESMNATDMRRLETGKKFEDEDSPSKKVPVPKLDLSPVK